MFGSIKKILSGIVSFFLGFFSSKKSLEGKPDKPRKRNGYFLELEETEVPKELKAAAKSIASATNEVKAKASELVTAATTKESESNAKAEPAKAEPAKAEKVKTADAATPAKAETGKAEVPTKKQPPKVEVELVQTAEGVKAQAVKPTKPVKAVADSNGKAASTFAPNYLMPSASNSRRRPGANMNSFLDMARQVKTPG
ncbi:hypothetical protein [Chroococcidiopsis sp. CCNUC1]|uniref:hypothetical protein n=1 Tax=Chroococcidiopsis sp. CCNUC1 TaxID=2653189 RepID=UPI002020D053|nr:hypothetical protein [Chroococcidiopsis sp. CCNUC1]URD50015.1 hypothetical protein M5J74_27390 [Chroococcidiopsis sp. CCNUC1]